MSTFKRLFNVGKGKVRVARKGAADAVETAGSADWIDSARHGVADAAEALADAVRPPPRGEADSSEEPAPATPGPADEARDSTPSDVEEAEEIADEPPVDPPPPKRRL